jgi:hypothetical protein
MYAYVLPVPGGPYNRMPRTCLTSISFTNEGGNTRDTKARRKMSENCVLKPPIPILSKFQSGLHHHHHDMAHNTHQHMHIATKHVVDTSLSRACVRLLAPTYLNRARREALVPPLSMMLESVPLEKENSVFRFNKPRRPSDTRDAALGSFCSFLRKYLTSTTSSFWTLNLRLTPCTSSKNTCSIVRNYTIITTIINRLC